MQHCLRYLSLLLTLVLVGAGITSCSNDDTEGSSNPSFKVSLGVVGPNSAELKLKANAIAEYAYKCYPADKVEELTPAALFATGTTGACKNGTTTVTIPDLESTTDYVVHIAAKTKKNSFYSGTIAPVSFTTTDYTDEITIVKRTIDGFVAHVKLPADVVKRDNVVKWGLSNLLLYNMNKAKGLSDAEILDTNDEMYAMFFKKSATFTFDADHQYRKDENGELYIDEYGSEVAYWDFIAPGEPLLLLLGEHEYGESMSGWGLGWYLPMFNYEAWSEAGGGGGGGGPLLSRADEVSEDEFWTGYHKKIKERALEPEVLDAKVKFDATDLRPNGATLRFTPDEKVLRYCVGVFEDTTLNGQIMPFIDNDRNLLQWFNTSFAASFIYGVQTLSGPTELALESLFYWLTPGMTYHVVITGMGDEAGKTQCFAHETFELPMPTQPAPVVNVTGIKNPEGAESPYEVWFNVKAPNGDLETGGYACDYVRAFEIALDNNATYNSLIDENRQRGTFNSQEIARINSAAGYNMMFTSREDAATRLVARGVNSEGTASNPDEKDSPSIADNRTIRLPDAERVNSPLFTDLVGTWTATASVKFWTYDPESNTSSWVPVADPVKTKVTIAGGVTYPATLTDDVYEIYEDFTKEEVDGFYTDFKASADIFNQKVRGQNRLLCMGFNFDADPNAWYKALETASPYDLFVHPRYNSSIDGLFYDFGPKWFLQIAADGKVFVPVNVNRITPLTSWAAGTEYHLVAADETVGRFVPAEEDMDNVNMWPNISVEVSADRTKITLKGMEYTTPEDNKQHTLYPTVVYPDYSGSMAIFDTKVSSEVVLTRDWSEPAQAKSSAKMPASKNTAVPSMSSMLGKTLAPTTSGVVKPMQRPSSRTHLSTKPQVQYKRVKVETLTPEKIEANKTKYLELMKKPGTRK